ncbi:MAG: plasmid pRiA4b ORF-3 family protein [Alphaproteobacteria bacterium]|nr:plasmid pRiA4b ORF-3 family protein [Alphaproteobacteria bacterium]
MYGPFTAVQIKVSLDEIEPEVWRRLVLPITWNLEQLHLVIQAAFNWWNYHVHEFHIGGLHYGDAESWSMALDDEDPRVFSSREVRFRDIDECTVFRYLYDLGDCWQHTITIEKYESHDPPPMHATCIAGARARPPEDVGGVIGYENFLEIMSDRKNPEHAATKRWCGGHFDPEWFDLAVVNKDLRSALRPGVKRRLHQPRPKRS